MLYVCMASNSCIWHCIDFLWWFRLNCDMYSALRSLFFFTGCSTTDIYCYYFCLIKSENATERWLEVTMAVKTWGGGRRGGTELPSCSALHICHLKKLLQPKGIIIGVSVLNV